MLTYVPRRLLFSVCEEDLSSAWARAALTARCCGVCARIVMRDAPTPSNNKTHAPLHPLATTGASGSTNYSKLANVSIAHDMSPVAQAAAGINVPAPIALDGSNLVYPNGSGVEEPMPQQWEHWFVARNWNIARAANGSLGQPTL